MEIRILLAVLLLASACVESDPTRGPGKYSRPADAAAECIDRDQDGFGDACAAGRDCDDADPKVHVGCLRCATPAAGCVCEAQARPVSCFLDTTLADDGEVMCHEGTRYCRDGLWSECESILSYPKSARVAEQALVDPDASPERCDDCNVNCFVIRDNIDPTGGPIGTANQIQIGDGGGLSLAVIEPDASSQDAGVVNPSDCILGTAPDLDCDGIPDEFDPYPLEKPFATANPAIFLDIAPGEQGTGVVDLEFYLNSADVYFLVDQSSSMANERDQLQTDLTTGDFIQDPNYACSDFDFDFVPNNEQKSKGIIGAIRCLIRDANFGVGLFREIPFSGYAPVDQIVFENQQDITSDIASVISGVGRLSTEGNSDWPEASMLALNSVVTGNGMYFGTTKPGIPARSGCPAATWGYPCFRDSAIPIVIMFTDAMLHNGPTNNHYAYNSSYLGITAGTSQTYTTLAPTNEAWDTVADLGDLTDTYVSFVGDTTNMAPDLGYSAVTCSSSSDSSGHDAMFRFSLSATKTVSITTEGSRFDTTLALYSNTPTPPTVLPPIAASNDTAATAYPFGNIDNTFRVGGGSSAGLAADYSATDVGCNAHPEAPDATFSFTLTQPTRVALDSGGSAYGTVLSLFGGTPVGAPVYNTIVNTNDAFASAQAIGSMNGQYRGYVGDTSPAAIVASYTGAQVGCGAADAAPDAVYSFSLSQPTRVRISTEDSALDTVLSLTDGITSFPNAENVSNDNETAATAYALGALDGTVFQMSGSTSGMSADYSQTLVGCGASSFGRDAVYQFTLNAPKSVQIDTTGSSFDTVLSLFNEQIGAAETPVTLSNNDHETGLTAYDLGTVNAKKLVVSGGSTSSMASDYASSQIGCNASSSARDAVFRFSLASPTTVRIDTDDSSFDTVLSLHEGALPDLVATTLPGNGNEDAASAYVLPSNVENTYRSFDGSTSSMSADVEIDDGAGCSASTSARDAVFRFTVGTAGTYILDTEGSSFDTVLGLYPSSIVAPSTPTPTNAGTSGERKDTAVDVGALDGRWVSFTGDTSSMADDNNFNSCNAHSGSYDAYYAFSLSATRTVTIDTIGSSWDTVIGLFRSNDSQSACDNNSGGGTASRLTQELTAGSYYVIVTGRSNKRGGEYKISLRDEAASTNLLECDDDDGAGDASYISRSLSPGTYYAVVKGHGSSDRGSYRLNVRHSEFVSSANRRACDDDSGASDASRIERSLPAGDYSIVVTGTSSSERGPYNLTVQDVTTPPANPLLACNDDYGSGTSSRITQDLAAGTYYVVVKGRGSTSRGSYTLNVRDTSAAVNTVLECDHADGPSGTSLIERDLASGTYHVIVKGRAAADAGAYKLQVRDVSTVGASRIACNNTSSSSAGGRSYLQQDLAAGTYTVIMKGDSAGGGGAYQLSVRDATQIARDATMLSCDRNSGTGSTSSMSRSLAAGDYWVAVKGYDGNDQGRYQLNIGGGARTSQTYVPPTWAQTLAALQSRQVRVMSVLSCQDDPQYGNDDGDCNETRAQATALANTTDALGPNLEPLVFDIDGDGAGLSSTVVDGVAALAEYLEMSVQVRVNFIPDDNPGFDLVVSALDEPGDGCDGLIALEHQNCVPGASPRFTLAFTNPLDNPVPPNPNDPNGGYNFRAELIGDGQFIVDQIPIYIIPADLEEMGPPEPMLAAEGTYWQDVPSRGCSGNKRANWNDLSWSAELPEGTSVHFNVCTGETYEELEACSYSRICTITGGGVCSSDAECLTGSFCAASGNCQTITGGSCQGSSECPAGATCIANACTFAGQPVYVGNSLDQGNFKAFLRMQIKLTANSTATKGPRVHDWALTYLCTNTL